MRIVKLPPEDWAKFKELRLEALRTDGAAFGATIEATEGRSDEWWMERLVIAGTDPTRTVVFAEEDGKLVGIAGSYPESDSANVDIISMYVTPAHRGKGIGRLLLQTVVDGLAGYEVRLCVNSDQLAAVRLYERFGFVTIAETPLTRSDGSAYVQLYMALRR